MGAMVFGFALILGVPSVHSGGSHAPENSRPCAASRATDLDLLLYSPTRRVRALSAHLQEVTEEGARRSPAFAGLLMSLEKSDVLVHIVDEANLPPSTFAQVVLLPGKSEFRVLRVQVGNRRGGDDRIALLGHELFHVLEIAHAPEVRGQTELAAFYRRIGFATERNLQFDTPEAHDFERRIRRELKARGC